MGRLQFGYISGRTLTYGLYTAAGVVHTAAGTSLPEISGTSYYTVDDAAMETGDVGIVMEGTLPVGFGIHRPEIDDSLVISTLGDLTTLIESLNTLVESLNTLIALETTVASVVEADISFTLAAGSTYDDAYNNMVVSIKDADGTGDVIERRITDYVGLTKAMTVDRDYEFPIEVGDVVRIYLGAYSTATTAAQVAEIASVAADAVWEEAENDHTAAGTFGRKLHSWRGLER